MTLYRPRTVLLLFMLLIFATPVVGQEAGQKARGEVAPGILDSVAPMSMVEGLLTPDLLQFGDGGRDHHSQRRLDRPGIFRCGPC